MAMEIWGFSFLPKNLFSKAKVEFDEISIFLYSIDRIPKYPTFHPFRQKKSSSILRVV